MHLSIIQYIDIYILYIYIKKKLGLMADISSMGLPSPPNWARHWLLPLRAATLEVTGPVSNLDLAIVAEVTEGNYGYRLLQ
jgi:hypothetical protein